MVIFSGGISRSRCQAPQTWPILSVTSLKRKTPRACPQMFWLTRSRVGPSADLTPKYLRTLIFLELLILQRWLSYSASQRRLDYVAVTRNFSGLTHRGSFFPSHLRPIPIEESFSILSSATWNAWLPKSLPWGKRKKGVITWHVYKGRAWK